jgi:fructose-specific phosphotransferase system component IIB
MKARNITSFAAVDGLIFAAKIDVTTDQNGNQKNEIRTVITADHKDYESIMGRVNTVSNNIHNQNQQQSINNSNRPTWA